MHLVSMGVGQSSLDRAVSGAGVRAERCVRCLQQLSPSWLPAYPMRSAHVALCPSAGGSALFSPNDMQPLLPISIAPTAANIEAATRRGPAAPFVQPWHASPTRHSFTARHLVDIEATVVGEYVQLRGNCLQWHF